MNALITFNIYIITKHTFYAQIIFSSEGWFNHYISQQDYHPKWTAIDPVTKGQYLSVADLNIIWFTFTL